MTDPHETAARDLIAGNFVGAYGLPNPASNAPGDSSAVQSSTITGRVRAAGMSQADSEDQAATPQSSSITDPVEHGTRGPQGGVQSSGGGGGASSPLMMMIAFARFPAQCVKFVPPPTVRLVCAEAHRLERPG
jgi:hypothetical protein